MCLNISHNAVMCKRKHKRCILAVATYLEVVTLTKLKSLQYMIGEGQSLIFLEV